MRHVLMLPVLLLFLVPTAPVGAAGIRYAPAMNGEVVGFRLAGIEPDGDPLDQVILQTVLSPSDGMPRLHLIIDSYLENFKPDTTPILPDLLHPKRDARNLGGFLQGKVLITDDAGNVLYIGSFIGEAFLNSPNTDHNANDAVMHLYGSGPAFGKSGALKGAFTLYKGGRLSGSFTGSVQFPVAARKQVLANRGKKMAPVQKIVKVVTVRPGYMVGKATNGRSSTHPFKTIYGALTPVAGTPGASPAPTSTAPVETSPSTGRHLSPVTIVAGIGAIICFVLAGVMYWVQRSTQR